MVRKVTAQGRRSGALGGLLIWVCLLAWPGLSLAQADICGCIGHPNLGDFNSGDEATYPMGTTRVSSIITIPLPDNDHVDIIGEVIIVAGSQLAALVLNTGDTGEATVFLETETASTQLTVFVGTPPARRIPQILAPAVGLEIETGE